MLNKNLKKYLLSFCLLFGILVFTSNASALRVDELFFIGDSLADQGNCPVPYYTPPPITNGNTFAYYLGKQLGKNILPSSQLGTDYACVGASTGYTAIFPIDFFIKQNGIQQIQQLLNDHPNVQPHSLFVYWLGSDDILLSPPPAPLIPTPSQLTYPVFDAATSVNYVVTGLNMLQRAGARYMVVVNLSPLEKTPAALEESTGVLADYYRSSSIAFNQTLLQSVKNLGYEVIFIDLYSIYNYVVENSALYGYTNVTNGCTTNPLPGQTCATSFYFNDVHPTDKTHQLLADAMFSILTAPDFFASLAEVPFSLMQNQNALIRQQLYPQQQNREVGKVYPFIGGTWSPKTQPAISVDRVTFNSNNYNGTVGLLSLINENVLLGASFGRIINNTNYDAIGSNYTTNANAFSLFGSFQKEKFYANAIINYAKLTYTDIQRKFYIGPLMTVANSDTEGNQRGIAAQIGFNIIQNDNFQTGPILNADYQTLNVNGYTENTGTGVFDVAFDDQSNTSSIGGIGWQAAFNNKIKTIPITTSAFLMLNKQFAGGDRSIYFRQAIVPIDFASLPVTKPKAVFGTAGVNIAATFKHDLIVSLGYLAALGDDNMQSNVFLLSLSMPL